MADIQLGGNPNAIEKKKVGMSNWLSLTRTIRPRRQKEATWNLTRKAITPSADKRDYTCTHFSTKNTVEEIRKL